MEKTLILWRLSDVMDKYGIEAKKLAAAMGVSQNAVTTWRKNKMPAIGGDRLNQLLIELNKLRKPGADLITSNDLIQFLLDADELEEIQAFTSSSASQQNTQAFTELALA